MVRPRPWRSNDCGVLLDCVTLPRFSNRRLYHHGSQQALVAIHLKCQSDPVVTTQWEKVTKTQNPVCFYCFFYTKLFFHHLFLVVTDQRETEYEDKSTAFDRLRKRNCQSANTDFDIIFLVYTCGSRTCFLGFLSSHLRGGCGTSSLRSPGGVGPLHWDHPAVWDLFAEITRWCGTSSLRSPGGVGPLRWDRPAVWDVFAEITRRCGTSSLRSACLYIIGASI